MHLWRIIKLNYLRVLTNKGITILQSVQDYISDYFTKNNEHLSKFYPGITSSRLLLAFSDTCKVVGSDTYLGQGFEFFKDLERGKPLEYIDHSAYFYRSNFYVDKRVLIPRSETEILVGDALNIVKKNYHEEYSIAEVGVGSFAIGLSLLMDFDKKINLWGGDISLDALKVAEINLFRHQSRLHPEASVIIEKSDRFEKLNHKVDLIITNPPYIKVSAGKVGVHIQAEIYEPKIALYLEDGEYDLWYDDFFRDGSLKLREKGLFLMEGHEDCLLDLKEIAIKYFNHVEIKNDYTGRQRFLHASL